MGETEVDTDRRKGTVKWFNASKGFGFITPDEGEQELFVHQSTIKTEGFRSLREGERVEFDLEKGEDGRDKAVNVTGPDGSSPQGAPFIPRYTPTTPLPLPYGYPPPPPPPLPQPPGNQGHYYAPYPTTTASEGSGNRQHHGMAYPGYYCYYVPAPRYGGPWGAEAYNYQHPQQHPQAQSQSQQMLIRPTARSHTATSNTTTDTPTTPTTVTTVTPTIRATGFRSSQGSTRRSSGLQVVVHNLPWSCTWQQLKEVFSEWEVIRADVIVDDYGRSRGFGTVRFSSEEDAALAIDSINGMEIEGRKITVRLDRYA